MKTAKNKGKWHHPWGETIFDPLKKVNAGKGFFTARKAL
jgi:hypothetical protein